MFFRTQELFEVQQIFYKMNKMDKESAEEFFTRWSCRKSKLVELVVEIMHVTIGDIVYSSTEVFFS